MLEAGRETVAVSLAARLCQARARAAHPRPDRSTRPELLVSISSEVSPKFREYERTNTTVTNAYVKPIVDRYLRHLDEALKARGIRNELFVMQSNGGLISPDLARDFPGPHHRIRAGGGNPHVRHRRQGGGPRRRSSPSTWAAPPQSSAPSTTASPPSCRRSRSISSATRRAAACRSMCRPSR